MLFSIINVEMQSKCHHHKFCFPLHTINVPKEHSNKAQLPRCSKHWTFTYRVRFLCSDASTISSPKPNCQGAFLCYFLFLQPVQEKGNRFPTTLVLSLAKTGTTITSNKLFFGLNGGDKVGTSSCVPHAVTFLIRWG